MPEIIDKILARPDADRITESLHRALAEEKKRRLAFYKWITPSIKAEFINGEIQIPSPARLEHLNVIRLLSRLMSIHTDTKNLGIVLSEKAMISLGRNDYEPDIVFFKEEKVKGFTPDQMFFPAPDLVVEVLSKSTQKKDRGIKKEDYAAHGIPEYWIIDPIKQEIEQYLLTSPNDTIYFLPHKFSISEDIESKVIQGFTIPVLALFDAEVNVQTMKKL